MDSVAQEVYHKIKFQMENTKKQKINSIQIS